VRYPSEAPPPKAKAKAKPKAKAKAKAAPKARAASASTVRYPSQEPVLPTEEEAERTGARLKVKKTIAKARKAPELRAGALAELVDKDEPKPTDRPKPKAKAKARIKKVQIASPEAGVKRGRGRPKGAVGRAKRNQAIMG
jgi:colicin import membrane protein